MVNSQANPKRRSFPERLKRGFTRNWRLHMLILPALAALVMFRYAPMYGLQIAFKNFRLRMLCSFSSITE